MVANVHKPIKCHSVGFGWSTSILKSTWEEVTWRDSLLFSRLNFRFQLKIVYGWLVEFRVCVHKSEGPKTTSDRRGIRFGHPENGWQEQASRLPAISYWWRQINVTFFSSKDSRARLSTEATDLSAKRLSSGARISVSQNVVRDL